MALNARQIAFIGKLKNFANMMEMLYGEAFALKKCYEEEYDDEQDNSLLDSNEDLQETYSFDSEDVKTAINQANTNFINFWTNVAVSTREYGKDLRRIK